MQIAAFVMIDYVTVRNLIGPIILILTYRSPRSVTRYSGRRHVALRRNGRGGFILLGFIQFLVAATATMVIGLLNAPRTLQLYGGNDPPALFLPCLPTISLFARLPWGSVTWLIYYVGKRVAIDDLIRLSRR